MEDFSKEKIQKKASKILRNSKINVLKDEKEIVEILNKILNENDEIVDYILLDKVLNNIDMYIKTKEKMALAEEDYIFFNDLSKKLKKQAIRRTDGILYIPLFKVKSKDGFEKYFLTRENAKRYIEMNKGWITDNIIEIDENDNTDLAMVIDIIKRNF